MKKKNTCQVSVIFEELAVCKKDSSGVVVLQNSVCKKICGDRSNQICTDGCMKHYQSANPRDKKGTLQFKNKKMGDKKFDILMVNSGSSLLSLLYDLDKKERDDLYLYRKFNLTPRELEITLLVDQGQSNQEISSQLFISTKTVKTHINNILKKIPQEDWPRKSGE